MDLERLSRNASAIIKMFQSVFDTPQGLDLPKAMLYAAGLAGYACHRAVIANGESFVVAETKDGKKYYMGEHLNHYLLEGEYSVLKFCNGYFEKFAKKDEVCPDALAIVKKSAAALGDPGYRIWGRYTPENAYSLVKECWDGIFETMTKPYCENPSEWPVLYAIVLQNIMVIGTEALSAPVLYAMAVECMLYVSKMDESTI